MAKTLIAYFSHVGENLENNEIVELKKGNTEVVAEKIAQLTGGDLYQIEEDDPYPYKYDDCLKRARREDENNEHPALKGGVRLNMDEYDQIYIGFPIWYRTYPRVVATFLETYDFSGKTIVPEGQRSRFSRVIDNSGADAIMNFVIKTGVPQG